MLLTLLAHRLAVARRAFEGRRLLWKDRIYRVFIKFERALPFVCTKEPIGIVNDVYCVTIHIHVCTSYDYPSIITYVAMQSFLLMIGRMVGGARKWSGGSATGTYAQAKNMQILMSGTAA